MNESQAAGTVERGTASGEVAEAYAAGLEAAVLQGLGEAIANAVQAQQQLYTAGEAILAQAAARRLAGTAELPEKMPDGAPAAPPADLEALRQRLADRIAGAKPSGGASPAAFTRSLMTAFAESLDLLAAVNAQQMMGYVRVLLALELDYQGEDLGPAAAKVLTEVFDGEALVQLLAALAAERRAAHAGSDEAD